MSWIENSVANLLPLSMSGDFATALKEWSYTGHYVDLDDERSDCELCEHPEIKYQFEIENRHNGNRLLVGSECIRKFSISAVGEDGDELGLQESVQKLGRDRRTAISESEKRKVVNTLVELAMVDSEFEIDSFIDYFHARGAFTPNQFRVLIWRLQKHRINFARCKFKIVMRRNREKDQIRNMADWQFNSIRPYLSEQQKQIAADLREDR